MRHFRTGQTTVNKKAPIHYIIPINDTVHRPLQKCLQKNPPQKFHDKAVQSNVLWLNLNKIGEISILQSHIKQCNPSFRFHAPGSKHRYRSCTQTASAVPKYFPYLIQFCTGYRISSLKAKNERKTLIYTQLKIFRYNPHFVAIFRRILRY